MFQKSYSLGSDSDSQSDFSEALESSDSSSDEGCSSKSVVKVAVARMKLSRTRKVQLAACRCYYFELACVFREPLLLAPLVGELPLLLTLFVSL